ncbi:uncharacterized protein LOC123970310 [Micropterus dolomieu]|uniref:uncharacterized protein LOC123970310 n=1 Tax=Micropterus dolomieu TaxID=147949 RepID=UPI001E8CDDD8|nr:uncharacterized protein LOC123970310 [Micropterus dolomieu]XP_045904266.1 uncharacterized protein LOC123970310 [Micropterus dolomieu]XP_045904271.1 uncharacterized protein LOC123970310 [Micropterus dolomieu]XP_045904278.1 uncharacterized protein LOC123970310 [Micropterus dolomieu]XP_045904287.1 uncharacterized protein LOC123970310 [Micropterus dolomieu]XP_045904294.1 uncharacterized protein LOC123970310 [Micropterus dolomieu]
MAKWKLCFVLLLPLMVSSDSEVTLVKTIGGEPDVTPICTNETLSILTLIVCKIRTERSRGEECRLLYQHGQDFVHECDSRFTLMTENQTVFLHLTSLTPEDSGNYTCECSLWKGTYILHLNITVEEDEDAKSLTQMSIPSALIGVTIVLIMAGVILAFIYIGIRHGTRLKPLSSNPNMEPHDIEPYSTFMQRESGLYSTVRLHVANTNTNNSNTFT